MLNTADKLKIVECLPEIKSMFYKKIQDENERLSQKQFDDFVETDEFKSKKMELNNHIKEDIVIVKQLKEHRGEDALRFYGLLLFWDKHSYTMSTISSINTLSRTYLSDEIKKIVVKSNKKLFGIWSPNDKKVDLRCRYSINFLYEKHKGDILKLKKLNRFSINYIYNPIYVINMCDDIELYLLKHKDGFSDDIIVDKCNYKTDISKLINSDLSWELFLIDLLKLETVEEIDQFLIQNLPELKSLRENIYKIFIKEY